MRILSVLFILSSLSACSSIDGVYQGSKMIVGGVVDDVTGITTGTFDTISGVVKDVSAKATGESE